MSTNALDISRRALIFGIASLGIAEPAAAQDAILSSAAGLKALDRRASLTPQGLPVDRGLWLQQPHTGEELVAVFWRSGRYDRVGYTRICHLLRDWRQDLTRPMDPKLLHLLWIVQRAANFDRPVRINSGLRTQRTNATLEGAAPNSYHLTAQACDINIDGIDPSKIADYVWSMQFGGVGYYPTFVHIDSGPLRFWGRRT